MSQPTLYYFNARARAELSRLILAYAGVQYKDARVDSIDDSLRARLPFGQLPFYEDGEIQLAQSLAIVNYLAKKHGLTGANDIDRAHTESITQSLTDVFLPFQQARESEEKLAKFKSETLPKFIGIWEGLLNKNGGKHFVGKTFTVADLAIFHALDHLKFLGLDQLDQTKYPSLFALYKTVSENPNIAKYISARPVTKF